MNMNKQLIKSVSLLVSILMALDNIALAAPANNPKSPALRGTAAREDARTAQDMGKKLGSQKAAQFKPSSDAAVAVKVEKAKGAFKVTLEDMRGFDSRLSESALLQYMRHEWAPKRFPSIASWTSGDLGTHRMGDWTNGSMTIGGFKENGQPVELAVDFTRTDSGFVAKYVLYDIKGSKSAADAVIAPKSFEILLSKAVSGGKGAFEELVAFFVNNPAELKRARGRLNSSDEAFEDMVPTGDMFQTPDGEIDLDEAVAAFSHGLGVFASAVERAEAAVKAKSKKPASRSASEAMTVSDAIALSPIDEKTGLSEVIITLPGLPAHASFRVKELYKRARNVFIDANAVKIDLAAESRRLSPLKWNLDDAAINELIGLRSTLSPYFAIFSSQLNEEHLEAIRSGSPYSQRIMPALIWLADARGTRHSNFTRNAAMTLVLNDNGQLMPVLMFDPKDLSDKDPQAGLTVKTLPLNIINKIADSLPEYSIERAIWKTYYFQMKGPAVKSASAGMLDQMINLCVAHPVIAATTTIGLAAVGFLAAWRVSSPVSWYLWRVISSDDPTVFSASMKKLIEIGPSFVPYLMKAHADKNADVAIWASVALSEAMSDPSAVKSFVKILGNKYHDAASPVAETPDKIDDPRAAELLMRAISHGDRDSELCLKALFTINDPRLLFMRGYLGEINSGRPYYELTLPETAYILDCLKSGQPIKAQFIPYAEHTETYYQGNRVSRSAEISLDAPYEVTEAIVDQRSRLIIDMPEDWKDEGEAGSPDGEVNKSASDSEAKAAANEPQETKAALEKLSRFIHHRADPAAFLQKLDAQGLRPLSPVGRFLEEWDQLWAGFEAGSGISETRGMREAELESLLSAGYLGIKPQGLLFSHKIYFLMDEGKKTIEDIYNRSLSHGTREPAALPDRQAGKSASDSLIDGEPANIVKNKAGYTVVRNRDNRLWLFGPDKKPILKNIYALYDFRLTDTHLAVRDDSNNLIVYDLAGKRVVEKIPARDGFRLEGTHLALMNKQHILAVCNLKGAAVFRTVYVSGFSALTATHLAITYMHDSVTVYDLTGKKVLENISAPNGFTLAGTRLAMSDMSRNLTVYDLVAGKPVVENIFAPGGFTLTATHLAVMDDEHKVTVYDLTGKLIFKATSAEGSLMLTATHLAVMDDEHKVTVYDLTGKPVFKDLYAYSPGDFRLTTTHLAIGDAYHNVTLFDLTGKPVFENMPAPGGFGLADTYFEVRDKNYKRTLYGLTTGQPVIITAENLADFIGLASAKSASEGIIEGNPVRIEKNEAGYTAVLNQNNRLWFFGPDKRLILKNINASRGFTLTATHLAAKDINDRLALYDLSGNVILEDICASHGFMLTATHLAAAAVNDSLTFYELKTGQPIRKNIDVSYGFILTSNHLAAVGMLSNLTVYDLEGKPILENIPAAGGFRLTDTHLAAGDKNYNFTLYDLKTCKPILENIDAYNGLTLTATRLAVKDKDHNPTLYDLTTGRPVIITNENPLSFIGMPGQQQAEADMVAKLAKDSSSSPEMLIEHVRDRGFYLAEPMRSALASDGALKEKLSAFEKLLIEKVKKTQQEVVFNDIVLRRLSQLSNYQGTAVRAAVEAAEASVKSDSARSASDSDVEKLVNDAFRYTYRSLRDVPGFKLFEVADAAGMKFNVMLKGHFKDFSFETSDIAAFVERAGSCYKVEMPEQAQEAIDHVRARLKDLKEKQGFNTDNLGFKTERGANFIVINRENFHGSLRFYINGKNSKINTTLKGRINEVKVNETETFTTRSASGGIIEALDAAKDLTIVHPFLIGMAATAIGLAGAASHFVIWRKLLPRLYILRLKLRSKSQTPSPHYYEFPFRRHSPETALVRMSFLAVPYLKNELNNRDFCFRSGMAKILQRIGYKPATQDEKILYFYAAQRWSELAKIGSQAVPYLRKAYEDANFLNTYSMGSYYEQISLRLIAAAMAETGDPGLFEFFIAILGSNKIDLHSIAAYGLGNIKDIKAAEPLKRARVSDDPECRAKAADALVKIGCKPVTQREKLLTDIGDKLDKYLDGHGLGYSMQKHIKYETVLNKLVDLALIGWSDKQIDQTIEDIIKIERGTYTHREPARGYWESVEVEESRPLSLHGGDDNRWPPDKYTVTEKVWVEEAPAEEYPIETVSYSFDYEKFMKLPGTDNIKQPEVARSNGSKAPDAAKSASDSDVEKLVNDAFRYTYRSLRDVPGFKLFEVADAAGMKFNVMLKGHFKDFSFETSDIAAFVERAGSCYKVEMPEQAQEAIDHVRARLKDLKEKQGFNTDNLGFKTERGANFIVINRENFHGSLRFYINGKKSKINTTLKGRINEVKVNETETFAARSASGAMELFNAAKEFAIVHPIITGIAVLIASAFGSLEALLIFVRVVCKIQIRRNKAILRGADSRSWDSAADELAAFSWLPAANIIRDLGQDRAKKLVSLLGASLRLNRQDLIDSILAALGKLPQDEWLPQLRDAVAHNLRADLRRVKHVPSNVMADSAVLPRALAIKLSAVIECPQDVTTIIDLINNSVTFKEEQYGAKEVEEYVGGEGIGGAQSDANYYSRSDEQIYGYLTTVIVPNMRSICVFTELEEIADDTRTLRQKLADAVLRGDPYLPFHTGAKSASDSKIYGPETDITDEILSGALFKAGDRIAADDLSLQRVVRKIESDGSIRYWTSIRGREDLNTFKDDLIKSKDLCGIIQSRGLRVYRGADSSVLTMSNATVILNNTYGRKSRGFISPDGRILTRGEKRTDKDASFDLARSSSGIELLKTGIFITPQAFVSLTRAIEMANEMLASQRPARSAYAKAPGDKSASDTAVEQAPRRKISFAVEDLITNILVGRYSIRLNAADAATRADAAKMLGMLNNPRAITPLINSLGDEDPAVRKACAGSLADLGWKPAAELAELKTELGKIDKELARLQEDKKNGTSSARSPYAKAPGDKSASGGVLDKLIPMIPSDTVLIVGFFVFFGSVFAYMFLSAILSDRSLRYQFAPAIWHMHKLKGNNASERARSAEILGRKGGRRAIEPLKRCLNDSDGAVRYNAANSLISLGWQPTAVDEKISLFIKAGRADELVKIGSPAASYMMDIIDKGGNDLRALAFAAGVLGRMKGPAIIDFMLEKCLNAGYATAALLDIGTTPAAVLVNSISGYKVDKLLRLLELSLRSNRRDVTNNILLALEELTAENWLVGPLRETVARNLKADTSKGQAMGILIDRAGEVPYDIAVKLCAVIERAEDVIGIMRIVDYSVFFEKREHGTRQEQQMVPGYSGSASAASDSVYYKLQDSGYFDDHLEWVEVPDHRVFCDFSGLEKLADDTPALKEKLAEFNIDTLIAAGKWSELAEIGIPAVPYLIKSFGKNSYGAANALILINDPRLSFMKDYLEAVRSGDGTDYVSLSSDDIEYILKCLETGVTIRAKLIPYTTRYEEREEVEEHDADEAAAHFHGNNDGFKFESYTTTRRWREEVVISYTELVIDKNNGQKDQKAPDKSASGGVLELLDEVRFFIYLHPGLTAIAAIAAPLAGLAGFFTAWRKIFPLSWCAFRMNSKDPGMRARAAKILGSVRSIRATALLMKALGDDDYSVRSNAARSLGMKKDPNTVEPLINMLSSVNPNIRSAAAEALGVISDPRSVGPLIALLSDEDVSARCYAARGLGNIGDLTAVEPLIALLGERDYNSCSAAAEALGKLKDLRAVEPLIKVFGDCHYLARPFVGDALGKLKDPRATGLLTKALGDRDPKVRSMAAKALGEIGDMRAAERLIEAFGDKNSDVCTSAEQALTKIGSGTTPLLVKTLRNSSARARHYAARVLVSLGWEPDCEDENISYLIAARLWDELVRTGAVAVDLLIADLGNANYNYRHTIAEVLGKIGGPRAIESLLRSIDDLDINVRKSAARAILSLNVPGLSFMRDYLLVISSSDPEHYYSLSKNEIEYILQCLGSGTPVKADYSRRLTHTESEEYETHNLDTEWTETITTTIIDRPAELIIEIPEGWSPASKSASDSESEDEEIAKLFKLLKGEAVEKSYQKAAPEKDKEKQAASQENKELMQFKAAERLSKKGAEVIPGLEKLLTHTDASARENAAFALGLMRKNASSTAPAIARLLKDADRDAQRTAAWALGEIGNDDSDIIDALRNAASTNDPYLPFYANAALKKLNQEPVAQKPFIPSAAESDSSIQKPGDTQKPAAAPSLRNFGGLGKLFGKGQADTKGGKSASSGKDEENMQQALDKVFKCKPLVAKLQGTQEFKNGYGYFTLDDAMKAWKMPKDEALKVLNLLKRGKHIGQATFNQLARAGCMMSIVDEGEILLVAKAPRSASDSEADADAAAKFAADPSASPEALIEYVKDRGLYLAEPMRVALASDEALNEKLSAFEKLLIERVEKTQQEVVFNDIALSRLSQLSDYQGEAVRRAVEAAEAAINAAQTAKSASEGWVRSFAEEAADRLGLSSAEERGKVFGFFEWLAGLTRTYDLPANMTDVFSDPYGPVTSEKPFNKKVLKAISAAISDLSDIDALRELVERMKFRSYYHTKEYKETGVVQRGPGWRYGPQYYDEGGEQSIVGKSFTSNPSYNYSNFIEIAGNPELLRDAMEKTKQGQAEIYVLIAGLRSDKEDIREKAIKDLSEYGASAIPALIYILTKSDADAWRASPAAAKALGKIGAPAVPAVMKLLSDSYARIDRLAFKQELYSRASFFARMARDIREFFYMDKDRINDSSARSAAITALGEIGPAAAPAIPLLNRAVNEEDAGLFSNHEKAQKALAKIRGASAISSDKPGEPAPKAGPVKRSSASFIEEMPFWTLDTSSINTAKLRLRPTPMRSIMSVLRARSWMWRMMTLRAKEAELENVIKKIKLVQSKLPEIIATLKQNRFISTEHKIISVYLAGSYPWNDNPNDLDLAVIVDGDMEFTSKYASELPNGARKIVPGLMTSFEVGGLETLKKAVRGEGTEWKDRVARRKAAVYAGAIPVAGADIFAKADIPLDGFAVMRDDLLVGAQRGLWPDVKDDAAKLEAKKAWRMREADALDAWLCENILRSSYLEEAERGSVSHQEFFNIVQSNVPQSMEGLRGAFGELNSLLEHLSLKEEEMEDAILQVKEKYSLTEHEAKVLRLTLIGHGLRDNEGADDAVVKSSSAGDIESIVMLILFGAAATYFTCKGLYYLVGFTFSTIWKVLSPVSWYIAGEDRASEEALIKMGAVAVPSLVKALNNKNSRTFAATVLARMDDPSAAKAVSGIKDPAIIEWLVKQQTNYGSGNHEYLRKILFLMGPEAVPYLIKGLGSSDKRERSCFAALLGEFKDPRAYEPLINALTDDDEDVRESAVYALDNMDGQGTVELLIKLIGDKDPAIRKAAKTALITRRSFSAPVFIKLLGDANPYVRAAAAEILGSIGDTGAVEPLVNSLDDKNQQVIVAAAEALSKLGDARAVEPLIKTFVNVDSDIRRASARALDALGWKLPAQNENIKHLTTAEIWILGYLTDKDSWARSYAAKRLLMIQDMRLSGMYDYLRVVAANEPNHYQVLSNSEIRYISECLQKNAPLRAKYQPLATETHRETYTTVDYAPYRFDPYRENPTGSTEHERVSTVINQKAKLIFDMPKDEGASSPDGKAAKSASAGETRGWQVDRWIADSFEAGDFTAVADYLGSTLHMYRMQLDMYKESKEMKPHFDAVNIHLQDMVDTIFKTSRAADFFGSDAYKRFSRQDKTMITKLVNKRIKILLSVLEGDSPEIAREKAAQTLCGIASWHNAMGKFELANALNSFIQDGNPNVSMWARKAIPAFIADNTAQPAKFSSNGEAAGSDSLAGKERERAITEVITLTGMLLREAITEQYSSGEAQAEELEEIAQKTKDPLVKAVALTGMSLREAITREYSFGEAQAEELEEIAQKTKDPLVKAVALTGMSLREAITREYSFGEAQAGRLRKILDLVRSASDTKAAGFEPILDKFMAAETGSRDALARVFIANPAELERAKALYRLYSDVRADLEEWIKGDDVGAFQSLTLKEVTLRDAIARAEAILKQPAAGSQKSSSAAEAEQPEKLMLKDVACIIIDGTNTLWTGMSSIAYQQKLKELAGLGVKIILLSYGNRSNIIAQLNSPDSVLKEEDFYSIITPDDSKRAAIERLIQELGVTNGKHIIYIDDEKLYRDGFAAQLGLTAPEWPNGKQPVDFLDELLATAQPAPPAGEAGKSASDTEERRHIKNTAYKLMDEKSNAQAVAGIMKEIDKTGRRQELISVLLEIVNKNDGTLWNIDAAALLGTLKDRAAVSGLLKILPRKGKNEWYVAHEIIMALKAINDRSAIPALVKALYHPDSTVSLAARDALVHFGSASVPALKKVRKGIVRAESKKAYELAQQAIRQIGSGAQVVPSGAEAGSPAVEAGLPDRQAGKSASDTMEQEVHETILEAQLDIVPLTLEHLPGLDPNIARREIKFALGTMAFSPLEADKMLSSGDNPLMGVHLQKACVRSPFRAAMPGCFFILKDGNGTLHLLIFNKGQDNNFSIKEVANPPDMVLAVLSTHFTSKNPDRAVDDPFKAMMEQIYHPAKDMDVPAAPPAGSALKLDLRPASELLKDFAPKARAEAGRELANIIQLLRMGMLPQAIAVDETIRRNIYVSPLLVHAETGGERGYFTVMQTIGNDKQMREAMIFIRDPNGFDAVDLMGDPLMAVSYLVNPFSDIMRVLETLHGTAGGTLELDHMWNNFEINVLAMSSKQPGQRRSSSDAQVLMTAESIRALGEIEQAA